MVDFQNYKCIACTYKCRTMAGFGKDSDREGRTCVCENKNVLVEVTTKIYRGVNQGMLDIIQREYKQCPYCHDKKYHPWPKNHPCPKCGEEMIPVENSLEYLRQLREKRKSIEWSNKDGKKYVVVLKSLSSGYLDSGGYTEVFDDVFGTLDEAKIFIDIKIDESLKDHPNSEFKKYRPHASFGYELKAGSTNRKDKGKYVYQRSFDLTWQTESIVDSYTVVELDENQDYDSDPDKEIDVLIL